MRDEPLIVLGLTILLVAGMGDWLIEQLGAFLLVPTILVGLTAAWVIVREEVRRG